MSSGSPTAPPSGTASCRGNTATDIGGRRSPGSEGGFQAFALRDLAECCCRSRASARRQLAVFQKLDHWPAHGPSLEAALERYPRPSGSLSCFRANWPDTPALRQIGPCSGSCAKVWSCAMSGRGPPGFICEAAEFDEDASAAFAQQAHDFPRRPWSSRSSSSCFIHAMGLGRRHYGCSAGGNRMRVSFALDSEGS